MSYDLDIDARGQLAAIRQRAIKLNLAGGLGHEAHAFLSDFQPFCSEVERLMVENQTLLRAIEPFAYIWDMGAQFKPEPNHPIRDFVSDTKPIMKDVYAAWKLVFGVHPEPKTPATRASLADVPVLCDKVERLAQRIAVLEADAGNDLEYKRITKAEVDRLRTQNEELRKTNIELRDKIYAWTGDGPAPAKWTAPDGTLVYRSYEDYCDD